MDPRETLGAKAIWLRQPAASGNGGRGISLCGITRDDRKAVAVFRRGLSETGFIEGRNLRIEHRWAHNDASRLPSVGGRSRAPPRGGQTLRAFVCTQAAARHGVEEPVQL